MVGFLHPVCSGSTDYILGYHILDSKKADARKKPDDFTDI